MKNSRFEIPREEFQDLFVNWLYGNGFDGYGIIEDTTNVNKTDRGGFENETFLINPYYWGDDEKIMCEPNFIFKPLGVEIRWYKYPMRSAYSNKNITYDEMKNILNACKESLTN